MTPIDQIRASIEARIAELNHEITALQAARAALQGNSAGRSTTAGSPQRTDRRRRRRTTQAPSDGPAANVVPLNRNAAGTGAPTSAVTEAATRSATPRTLRSRTPARPSKSGQRVDVLLAGKLEAMLGEAGEGLSAVTISKRSNAGYNQVLALLRELERTSRVRRTGTRRTSLWRLITDEERIAQRAAELASLSVAK